MLASKQNGYQWSKQNNQQRVANIGLLTVVNDGRRDNQRRHENYRKHDNHYNHNQDRYARSGTSALHNDERYERPNNARRDNQRRYNNHDYNNQDKYMHGAAQVDERYEKYNNERHENHKRHDNYNRYDNQNKYGNQNKRDNYNFNRYDKQHKREDAQNRRDIQSRKEQDGASKLASRQNLIPAHTWRVVCDSMLGGLSSKLRMCGVDCVHVLFDQGGDDSAQLAMRENRILLTRNKNCEKVRDIHFICIYNIADVILALMISVM